MYDVRFATYEVLFAIYEVLFAIYEVRFAICEVRCMIGVLYSLGEAARTECNSHHPQCGDGDACARYRHLGEMLPTASPHIRVPQG